MYKGMYVAMSGAMLRMSELDNVANNLANASTVGYKKTSFSSQLASLLEGPAKKQNVVYPEARSMSYFNKYQVDSAAGNVKMTGNPLDLAVSGEGFLSVERKGQAFYTRNGSLSVNKEGFVVTSNGFKLLDTTGNPISLSGGGNIGISQDGTISLDGNNVGKIKLSNVANVQHVGDSLFSGNESGPAAGEIIQGGLEMSNVNVISEMIGIVTALRQYDSATKTIQAFDDLAKRTVEIART